MGEALNSMQQRVENKFWGVLIPWLEGLEENPRTQKFIHIGYRFQERFLNRSSMVFALMVSSLGLMIGLGIGAVLAYII